VRDGSPGVSGRAFAVTLVGVFQEASWTATMVLSEVVSAVRPAELAPARIPWVLLKHIQRVASALGRVAGGDCVEVVAALSGGAVFWPLQLSWTTWRSRGGRSQGALERSVSFPDFLCVRR
jgi:hypothetical protein